MESAKFVLCMAYQHVTISGKTSLIANLKVFKYLKHYGLLIDVLILTYLKQRIIH